ETRLTIHAWNWYRDRYYASKGAPAPGPALIDPALFPGGNGETPITAAQYHQLVSGQTLAGLGYVYLG
ncbi:MAG TPA: hypothetical protein DEH78_33355, partial [Solibacterales bacterium]|nr:hypothetical protein [Bryobacterales bacterium]